VVALSTRGAITSARPFLPLYIDRKKQRKLKILIHLIL